MTKPEFASSNDEKLPPKRECRDNAGSLKSETPTDASIRPVVDALRQQLEDLGLSTRGRRQELQKRLRAARKKAQAGDTAGVVDPPIVQKLSAASENEQSIPATTTDPDRPEGSQPYDFYCVLDVEATCDKDTLFEFPNEIIEFPVILIDGRTMEAIATFHRYVRPVVNPLLSDFCIELTGITQDVVDGAKSFPEMMCEFEEWLGTYTTYPFDNVMFVCDGPWDIRDFIRKQCEHSVVSRPPYLCKFVDLRRLYIEHYHRERANLAGMLAGLGMQFEGREHSGLDDAKNIARIVVKMMKEDGCIFKPNKQVKLSKRRVSRNGKVLYTTGDNNSSHWTKGDVITF
ncbi:ribonuclease H-like domain-containing protein [Fimicolochytrium jonesii]|uniref:ribonuclease H-like domain-containing protein n=1 Tax=Fimicolochytrium jonesii TaxID=1396493 RepID=UPI0022FEE17F|nr:ribonuclease H-like domain-containing protein [Fimicolochytrium jonesii]KAI8822515.1 ribonuclease H-like domain-containing protein [Fimicolochytrium jonesii]